IGRQRDARHVAGAIVIVDRQPARGQLHEVLAIGIVAHRLAEIGLEVEPADLPDRAAAGDQRGGRLVALDPAYADALVGQGARDDVIAFHHAIGESRGVRAGVGGLDREIFDVPLRPEMRVERIGVEHQIVGRLELHRAARAE
ncbi:hypothetical protein QU38_01350, partial [Staphylococcus aureus]